MAFSARPFRMALAVLAASATIGLVPEHVAPASAQVSVGIRISYGYFQDRLSRYGRWIYHPRWGEVWQPRTGRYYRPYYNGAWEYTDEVGWLWISDDPWGSLTDHYGRWVFDPRMGWLWVPGYVWGPSWVIWREANGYVGWFPMPPDYDDFDPYHYGPRYRANDWYGYRAWYPGFADTAFFSLWVFTTDRDFARPGPRSYITDPIRVRDVYRRSIERTRYVDVRNRIVDRSIDVRRIEERTHRRIEPQPARRFLANIPQTSVTEGRDLARRDRELRRGPGRGERDNRGPENRDRENPVIGNVGPGNVFGNGGRDNVGRDNLGRGNLGRGNVGRGETAPEREQNAPRQRQEQGTIERNREQIVPRGNGPGGRGDDNNVRLRDELNARQRDELNARQREEQNARLREEQNARLREELNARQREERNNAERDRAAAPQGAVPGGRGGRDIENRGRGGRGENDRRGENEFPGRFGFGGRSPNDGPRQASIPAPPAIEPDVERGPAETPRGLRGGIRPQFNPSDTDQARGNGREGRGGPAERAESQARGRALAAAPPPVPEPPAADAAPQREPQNQGQARGRGQPDDEQPNRNRGRRGRE